jgi:hypothetical protein
VQVNATSSEDSYSCADFASFYGVTMAQLLEWNPSLASRVENGDCYLWPGEQYCAQRDLDTTSNITQYCVERRVAESGPRSTCDGFVTWYGLDKASFLEWHPGLGSNCENFHSGKYLTFNAVLDFHARSKNGADGVIQKGHTYCINVRHFRPKGKIPYRRRLPG